MNLRDLYITSRALAEAFYLCVVQQREPPFVLELTTSRPGYMGQEVYLVVPTPTAPTRWQALARLKLSKLFDEVHP